MENFKEIAEKCLKGELSGKFELRNGSQISSNALEKSGYKSVTFPYKLYIPNRYFETYTIFGHCYNSSQSHRDIINFIPNKDMKTKEIKIEVPEGYEIDKENSSLERIVFKKKETKYPESWEEYCKNTLRKGYYISTASAIEGVELNTLMNSTSDKNILPTKELAKKFLAYMQLMSLRHEWIHIWSKEQGMEKDWEPDWNDRRFCKFCILCHDNELVIEAWSTVTFSLAFPTVELAENFIKKFRDLLEQAKGLY